MADEFLLSIEKLVYGGEGLAHADGATVFVPYVLPEENVWAKVRTRKKKLIHADLVRVEKASALRGTPVCPHFGSCGGCHYQHMEIAEQVRQKKAILRETLARLGGLDWQGAIPEHVGSPFAYRNRAQWALRNAPPRALGYYLPESSHIIAIDSCAVLSPRLADTFGRLQDRARASTLPPGILELEAFADGADERVALNVAFERFPKPAETLAAEFREAVPALTSLLMKDEKKDRFELDGTGYLEHRAGGFTYRVNHLSFFQVNRFLIGDLLEATLAGAHGTYALDLYAGVGFFTLPLAKSFSRVVSVDANLSATRDLRINAESAGLQVISENMHAEDFLRRTKDRPDFVLLDPPRAGLGAEATARLADLGPANIVYLSCDPSTLARDLAVLTGSPRRPATPTSAAHRYELSEVHLFDLFPQTFHIETLVKLRRCS